MLVAVLYRVRIHDYSLVVTRPAQSAEGGKPLRTEQRFSAKTKLLALAKANLLITPFKTVHTEKVVRIFVEGNGRIHGGARGGDYWQDKKALYNGPASIDGYRKAMRLV